MRIDGRLKIPALEGALTAAVSDLGVVMATAAAIRRELDSGSLVQLLPDWDMSSVDLQAVFTEGRAAKSSARALVAYLAEALSDA